MKASKGLQLRTNVSDRGKLRLIRSVEIICRPRLGVYHDLRNGRLGSDL